jgi:pyruvate kinase
VRRTKIIATIGPATDAPGVLDALIAAGVDVARINASHAGPDDLEKRLRAIREVETRSGRSVGVLLDLAGPKIRVGDVRDGTRLEPGAAFVLASGICTGDAQRACVTCPGLPGDVSIGDRVLIDDGRIELAVTRTSPDEIETSVVVGGALSSHKGVNVPGVRLRVDAITASDRDVLGWGVDAGVDMIAQSFVRGAHDVRALREAMGDRPLPIVAKIEKHEAADDIEAIVDEADAVMVARGDLGVETSPEEVPVLQRRIIEACRASGTPVVVATQMLESMTAAPRPTRAEASDVANAIFDRVDAVMLSAETAVGAYPVESVATMARIARTAEESLASEPRRAPLDAARPDVTLAVSSAVCGLAEDLNVAAIVTATQSGATARAVARHRPRAPIIAVTPFASVARALGHVWGVHPIVAPVAAMEDFALEALVAAVRDAGLVSVGQRVAVTAGVTRGLPGSTDLILVRDVPIPSS